MSAELPVKNKGTRHLITGKDILLTGAVLRVICKSGPNDETRTFLGIKDYICHKKFDIRATVVKEMVDLFNISVEFVKEPSGTSGNIPVNYTTAGMPIYEGLFGTI